mmetsp:Transcript_102/g.272  ORF Transcript_102/g.272 Transcript_102/m.272 type:complete len:562 (-) Transcript_102:185-1870(-)|eukprot:CAMPEP_0168303308 /NCGR_PEP_ID=MMETSP0142_2-20121227/42301_1 /TAXON_ID=44445 /ORGANISM="Pseudo-nitzschia australis, Strain 10249 10 AB" /LENGTH=561 /DNA_ID=CAMNT_0008254165 /DNA_START=82 /DNA_END=1767 /DNA_ORIENTATION=+
MSSTSDILFSVIATSAASVVVGLILLQTDRVSRKILDPAQLNTKRRSEYKYSWTKAVDKAKLLLDYSLAGGPREYNEDPEIVMRNTEYISKEEDLDALIEKIVDRKDTKSRFYGLKIDKDPLDPLGEYYLFIVHEQELSDGKTLYQLPLVKFGMKLAEAFEDELTTTALCFVADASAGKAASMLESLVKESKAGVAIISEPFWMMQIARLAEASVLAAPKIKKIIFALCRLDAWSVRQEIGDAKTVMFTLPGQAVVASLLPLVQSAFPEDRHIFAYDGCVASVKRGIYAERMYKRNRLIPGLKTIIQGMGNDPVRITTPLPSNYPLSHDASLGGRGGAMERSFAQVPLQQARIVEAWISSVDAYFKLKNEEAANGYVPFCFKLGFLACPKGDFEYGTDSYWCLNSFLQYVTGCQGRAVPEGVIDAAREWMKDYNSAQVADQTAIEKAVALSVYEETMIENCCFQHKQILIGNKTLQDTVLPKEHWTMKQASRNGCSCCGPDPYDEMEEEEESDNMEESKSDNAITSNMGIGNLNMTIGSSKPTGYVDATQVFAFDPSRFSM